MDPAASIILYLFTFMSIFSLLTLLQVDAAAKPARPVPQITVMGVVYCDLCSNNTLSPHSYFLRGAEVRIDCRFNANSPRTTEEILLSVNRTTNKHGIYKLNITSIEGVECATEMVGNSCRASLIKSTSSLCNVPGYRSTSDEFSVKSKQENLCIYSLSALNFRPSKKDLNFCGKV